MAWNWLKGRRRLPIMVTCPKNCSDRKLDDIVAVSKAEVMENLDLDGEMRLEPNAKLLHCRRCGCVWQRTFDTDALKFHDEIMGTFKEMNASRQLQMR